MPTEATKPNTSAVPAGPKPGATTSAAGTPTPATGAPVNEESKAPVTILKARTDIPVPVIKSNRGSKSKYELDKLEIGQSIGVKGRNAASLASTVSAANRAALKPKLDANGAVIYKTTEATDAAGVTTRIPTDQPETVPTKRFYCADVDAKNDPDGAECRIWRIEL